MKRHIFRWPMHISRLLASVFLFASIGSIGASVFFWPASAEAQPAQKAVLHRDDPLVRAAIAVQNRHTESLLRIPDVVGTGVGVGPDGLPVIKVFATRAGVPGIPDWLESIPVQVEVTGMVVALTDPTQRFRPAYVGVSTGHPLITAGTIGARVKDSTGNVFVLSNNHVLANSNSANLGDSALQPGPYDGGRDLADKIGELFDFQPIDFYPPNFNNVNYIDAAIASSSTDMLGNSTPGDDGYGTPSSVTTGASIGLLVQKYGRTTGRTHGQIAEINVAVTVCYEQFLYFCLKSANFYDQIAISPGGFSAGGDSGSLIVTDDGNKQTVALLFAGSSTRTIGNRINYVLDRFGVSIDDGGPAANHPPVADFIYTTNVLTAYFTDQSTDSDGSVVAWSWDFGDSGTSTTQHPTHTYATGGTYPVTLTVTDDDGDTGTKTRSVTVGEAPLSIHVGDLDGGSTLSGRKKWNATVTVTVHDAAEDPVPGAAVVGTWSDGASGTGSCTTGAGGSCSITKSGIPNSKASVTFTVTNVTHASQPYDSAANHDPDGGSNGTTISIRRP